MIMNSETNNNSQGFYHAQLDIREHEESTKRALLLKRKELKWKLMQVSQQQNRAKLDEIKAEANYYKRRTIKITALAYKLRAKYLKVAKAAQIAESLHKQSEQQLLTHEKFVADEKMQLTKLAFDCTNIGQQLYGPSYKLPDNPKVFPKQSNSDAMAKRRSKPCQTRLSSLYDLKDSLLRNLASYRLTTKFENTNLPITDLNYAHNICPFEYICLPDLIGTCSDKDCLYQHKSNYLMSDIDKLADILSYKPSLTGFKPDLSVSQNENETMCRLKLRQYAAKLLAKNGDKPVETIAQNLVKYLRLNKTDLELLTLSRELPKSRHLICSQTSPLDDSTMNEEDEMNEPSPDQLNGDLEDEEIEEEDDETSEGIKLVVD